MICIIQVRVYVPASFARSLFTGDRATSWVASGICGDCGDPHFDTIGVPSLLDGGSGLSGVCRVAKGDGVVGRLGGGDCRA